jgi:hypothetical protein
MIKLHQEPSEFYERASEHLATASAEELISWLNSPVTIALLTTLKGDYEGHVLGWVEGSATAESVDGSMQRNAKAIGSVHAITGIFEWVEDLKRNVL